MLALRVAPSTHPGSPEPLPARPVRLPDQEFSVLECWFSVHLTIVTQSEWLAKHSDDTTAICGDSERVLDVLKKYGTMEAQVLLFDRSASRL